ncbi:spore coat protein A [Jeongeupia sp. HS-3]|uniref:multicopper oxidase family protein n=1 Tax=Jeongeupia sp. HS-3 TaxID=1009682 RepID=UPI0018A66432|nr:multicopper oxidase domain-containing protein [Jeongeupia sp. HS-3]BCL74571.1 spore coat protein A [Jeongeupia sp. HS-3]
MQANTAFGEAGRLPHQRWAELSAAQLELYELRAVERPRWVFNPSLPAQPVWVYEGANSNPAIFSPVITAHYGKPILCRFRNELPRNHVGFGSPEISTHLHNLHCASESDGFPGDYFSASKAGPGLTSPGSFKDHFYPNILAGYDQFQNGYGDVREALGTLFYHDHTLDFTGPNVYRGLSGFYLLYDELDSGNERDPNPRALRLPSGPYDYPLNFMDRRFDQQGKLLYDQLNPDGILGDKVVVNGKIEPVLRVAARKYRFRLLNSGPSRFYEFYLVNRNDVAQTFTYLANDGNLLPEPLWHQTKVRLGVAERADIVIDFSAYPIGTELYIVNRLRQEETRKAKDVRAPGVRVLKLIVDRYPSQPDASVIPSTLRQLPPISAAEIASAKVRRWEFERKNGMWVINDKVVDLRAPRIKIKRGSAEIWELVNDSGGWAHPIHIHFEEGRILKKSIEGVEIPIPPHERGRKDVFVLEPNMTIRIFLRFRDFTGKYVMHCHNLIHEDHAMMLRWDIED